MYQVVLIAAVLVIFFLYLRSRSEVRLKRPKNELELRCDFYYQQIVNFLRRLRHSRSKTRIRRLESEIERFQKVMDLDDVLEKAETETNLQKAIDYYLEALSFMMNNNFEKERKAEIEEKIRNLQERKRNQVLRQ